jgi:hypothetical protein
MTDGRRRGEPRQPPTQHARGKRARAHSRKRAGTGEVTTRHRLELKRSSPRGNAGERLYWRKGPNPHRQFLRRRLDPGGAQLAAALHLDVDPDRLADAQLLHTRTLQHRDMAKDGSAIFKFYEAKTAVTEPIRDFPVKI